ncbi:hypothetical protein [Phormidesmis priestleyi]|uniref:hypothetical protein n=1 Tax=Phormidesmis priestleyi TaxID=268141 RepID=UPI000ABD78EE|nr:hypothetical protein [Phormidesmis priestleyi]
MTFSQVKQFLLGKTLPTSAHDEERLTKAAALAVLSSDALSSVAYATQETLIVLVAAGSGAGILGFSVPIAGAIVVLLVLVILSYRQTIRAYPKGGGSYYCCPWQFGAAVGLNRGCLTDH